MKIKALIILMISMGIVGTIYHKKFFLSLLLSLELLLLKLIVYNIYTAVTTRNVEFTSFSIFIVALSAVEARVGISLIALLSRKFVESRIKTLKTLKS